MGELRYESGSTHEVVEMDGPAVFTDGAVGLRSFTPSYSVGYRSVSGYTSPATVKTVEVKFRDPSDADRLVDIINADMSVEKPGTITAAGWSQRGYIARLEPTEIRPSIIKATLDCVLLDGVWRKPQLFHLFPESGDRDGTKVYSYTYPYRYSAEFGSRYVSIGSKTPSPFTMCIFGFTSNPSIKIGENVYTFETDVPQDGYLLVDSRDFTATIVYADGARVDAYSSVVRGAGEGCGTYGFERIPAGYSHVIWNDMFGFDLTLFHERGAPPYESSGVQP